MGARSDDPRASGLALVVAAITLWNTRYLARALDDPRYWCLCTEWDSVGSYRRALSSYEVKVDATPLLAESVDEPSAYEVLASAPPGGGVDVGTSDRAADPAGGRRSRS